MEKRTILQLSDLLEELYEEDKITEVEYETIKSSINAKKSDEKHSTTIDVLGMEISLEDAYQYLMSLKLRHSQGR